MTWWLWGLLLGASQAQEPPEKKGNWLTNIRYAVGVASSAGGGFVGTTDVGTATAEPFALEFRSYFTPMFAWHTTLNTWRMVYPAAARAEGRLDYDLHVAGHVPVAPRTELVVGPGASIAYAPGKNFRYNRFVGDVRLGIDVHQDDRRWTWGIYARPYVGWMRTDATANGPARQGVTAGLLAEVVVVAHIATKKERAARRAAPEEPLPPVAPPAPGDLPR